MSRAHCVGLLALAVLAGALWWWTEAERTGGRPLVDATGERGPDNERDVALAPVAGGPDGNRSPQEDVVATALPSSSADERSDRSTRVRVGARLVDERGAALARGRLSVRLGDGEEESAEGREDGEVELEFELERIQAPRFSLQACAPGRVRKRSVMLERSALAEAGALHLGEIVLGPGGALVGRVVDEAGALVPEATLGAILAVADPSAEQLAAWRARPPWPDFGDGIQPTARTGVDGRYQLEGVPAGRVTLFASDGHHLPDNERDLEVRAGGTTRVRDLVLREPAESERIAGIVRHEDGRPFAGASVRLMNEEESGYYPQSTDASGRFEFLVVGDRGYVIQAHDPSNRRLARKKGVRAGDVALELRFGAAGVFEVFARDADGPVEAFRVLAYDAKRRHVASSGEMQAPGLVRVDLPEESFSLYLDGPEHLPREAGPYEPASVPPRLELVLQRAGGIAGVVLLDDRPVAGAEVHAHRPIWQAAFGELDEGFATLVDNQVAGRVSTDESGRFFVPLRPGRYRLHAETTGQARASSDWHEVIGVGRVADVELRLPAAGAIEGRARTAPGVEARGIPIGATGGDGHVLVERTAEEGRFRFEGLAPGSWQVHRLGADGSVSADEYSAARKGDELRWDLEVLPSKTAFFEIDARAEVPCTLAGRLAFGGVAPSGWSAWIWNPSGEQRSTTIDAEGRFAMRAAKPGKYTLGFAAAWSAVDVALWLELELLPGENLREIDVPAGALTLENLPPVPPADARFTQAFDWPEFALSWSEGAYRWSASFQENAERRAVLENVPAGALVLRVRGEGQNGEDTTQWPVLAETELVPGERKLLVLD